MSDHVAAPAIDKPIEAGRVTQVDDHGIRFSRAQDQREVTGSGSRLAHPARGLAQVAPQPRSSRSERRTPSRSQRAAKPRRPGGRRLSAHAGFGSGHSARRGPSRSSPVPAPHRPGLRRRSAGSSRRGPGPPGWQAAVPPRCAPRAMAATRCRRSSRGTAGAHSSHRESPPGCGRRRRRFRAASRRPATRTARHRAAWAATWRTSTPVVQAAKTT